MLMGFVASLRTLALGQGAAGSGVVGILVIVAVAAAAAAVLVFLRARATGAALGASRRQGAETQEALRALQVRERELTKKSEERHEELRELKQELAALRKKHHAMQEEGKSLREQLKAQAEERDRLLASRPAFEPVRPESKPKPKPAPQPVAPPPVAPVTVVAPPPAPAAAGPDPELLDRIAKLEAERAGLATSLAAEREALEQHKAEVSRLRRYAEQLRRIDMISKGKVEVLEDKVAALGRQYYEAVSELAAMKGEVVPPRPRTEARSRPVRRTDGQAPGESEHATPDSDALAAQMDAADAEAGTHEHDEGDESTGEPRASEA